MDTLCKESKNTYSTPPPIFGRYCPPRISYGYTFGRTIGGVPRRGGPKVARVIKYTYTIIALPPR